MNELVPIILEQTDSNVAVYTDGWKAYDGLADYGYKNTTELYTLIMSLPMAVIILMV